MSVSSLIKLLHLCGHYLVQDVSFPSGHGSLHHTVIQSHYWVIDVFIEDFSGSMLAYWNINRGFLLGVTFIVMISLTSLCLHTLSYDWLSCSGCWAFSEDNRWHGDEIILLLFLFIWESLPKRSLVCSYPSLDTYELQNRACSNCLKICL